MKPGDKVKYNGRHLRTIGVRHSDEKWTIVACSCPQCKAGRWVALDEQYDGYPRHIAPQALSVVGKPTIRDVDVDPNYPLQDGVR